MGLLLENKFVQNTAVAGVKAALVEKGLVQPEANTRGICFRASFKWLACKIAGLPFNYLAGKVQSAYGKQLDYLGEPDQLRSQGLGYEQWVKQIHEIDKRFLDKWGGRDRYGLTCDARQVEGLAGTVSMTPGGNENFVYCFYGTIAGRTGSDSFWGLAVAAFGGTPPMFFDSNCGDFTFDGKAVPGADMDAHVDQYTEGGYAIRDRFQYTLVNKT
jgi:hypothetical protein